jgi:TonB family protein
MSVPRNLPPGDAETGPGDRALEWPPTDDELAAIEVIDLGPPMALERASSPWTASPAGTTLVPIPGSHRIIPPMARPSRPRPRLTVARVVLSLALVEVVTFLQPPSFLERAAKHPAEVAAMAGPPSPDTGSTLSAPAGGPVMAPPADVKPRRSGERTARRFERTEEGGSRKEEGGKRSRPETRRAYGPVAGRPPVAASRQPATAGVAERANETAASDSAPPVTDAPDMRTALAYEPPRVVDQRMPTRVPSPFPVPRGSYTSLELKIDERGRVTAARITSSGAPFYDQSLLEAARTWRFRPAREDGHPAAVVHSMNVSIP